MVQIAIEDMLPDGVPRNARAAVEFPMPHEWKAAGKRGSRPSNGRAFQEDR